MTTTQKTKQNSFLLKGKKLQRLSKNLSTVTIYPSFNSKTVTHSVSIWDLFWN